MNLRVYKKVLKVERVKLKIELINWKKERRHETFGREKSYWGIKFVLLKNKYPCCNLQFAIAIFNLSWKSLELWAEMPP